MPRPIERKGMGLSPRVRGNRQHRLSCGHYERSIPAGAGEPSISRVVPRWETVYPRGCGGTYNPRGDFPAHYGLSPRVRGNRLFPALCRDGRRSIPAGAGEPNEQYRHDGQEGVYPRGCGGTAMAWLKWPKQRGLSPRVRGNRESVFEHLPALRSIPAGAGEPWPASILLSARRVYPRGCGGTGDRANTARLVLGLSPRVRGNQLRLPYPFSTPRSIPAGAGEPTTLRLQPMLARVYPRGCGGTIFSLNRIPTIPGLSPRVRGNPMNNTATMGKRGSIPAGAGEPISLAVTSRLDRVYPRGCGGTV